MPVHKVDVVRCDRAAVFLAIDNALFDDLKDEGLEPAALTLQRFRQQGDDRRLLAPALPMVSDADLVGDGLKGNMTPPALMSRARQKIIEQVG